MSSFSRLIVLSIFAAAGVGLAVCIALSDRPTPVSSERPRLAAKAVVQPAHGAAEQAMQNMFRPVSKSAENNLSGDQGASAADDHQATDEPPNVRPPAPPAIGPVLSTSDRRGDEQRFLIARPAPLIEVHSGRDGPDWVTLTPRPNMTASNSPPMPPLPPGDDGGPSLPVLETPAPAVEQEVTAPSNAQTKQQVRQSLDELRALLDQGSGPTSLEAVDKPIASGRTAAATNSPESHSSKSPAIGPGNPESPPPAQPAKSRPKIVKSGEGDDH
jgi:hypothetical protein